MIEELSQEQKNLAEYMSELSEEAYEAGWMLGLEYALWLALENGPRSFGRLFISQEIILQLSEYSKKCGGWIVFDDNTEETYIDVESWKNMYKKNLKSYENKIS